MRFLTEEALAKHRDYLKTLNLKYSILKKSVACLEGKSIVEISRLRIERDIKSEALTLLYEIVMHDCFFCSFSEDKGYISSDTVREQYKNEANLLNLIYKTAMNVNHGFLIVYTDNGRIKLGEGSLDRLLCGYGKPMLALDLCEHCYYPDYGFDKREYLLSSIPYLRLDIFDKEK